MSYNVKIMDYINEKYYNDNCSLGEAFNIIDSYCRDNDKTYYINDVFKPDSKTIRVMVHKYELSYDCCFEIKEN